MLGWILARLRGQGWEVGGAASDEAATSCGATERKARLGQTKHEEGGRGESRAPRMGARSRLICLLLVALGWSIASVSHH